MMKCENHEIPPFRYLNVLKLKVQYVPVVTSPSFGMSV